MALGLGQTFGDIMNSIIPIILLVSLSMSP